MKHLYSIDSLQELVENLSLSSGVKIVSKGLTFEADLKNKIINIPVLEVLDNVLQSVLTGAIMHEAGHINYGKYTRENITNIEFQIQSVFEDIRIENKMEKVYKCRDNFDTLYNNYIPNIPWKSNRFLFKNFLVAIVVYTRNYRNLSFFPKNIQELIKDYSEFISIPNDTEHVLYLRDSILNKMLLDRRFDLSAHISEKLYLDMNNTELKQNSEKIILLRERLIKDIENKVKIKEKISSLKKRISALSIKVESATNKERKKEIRYQIRELREAIKRTKDADKTSITRKAIRDLKDKNKVIKSISPVYIHTDDFITHLNEALLTHFKSQDYRYQSSILEESCPKHLIYTKENDTIIDIIHPDYNKLDKIIIQSQGYIEYLKDFLRKYFKVTVRTQDVRGQKRGKLDRFNLHKKFRIFKQVDEKIKKDTAIEIMIDNSGSMLVGNRIDKACQLGYILASVVKELKISSEVIAYHSEYHKKFINMNGLENKFNRTHTELRHTILKPFNSNDLSGISGLVTDKKYHNVDNESIVFVGKRLLLRKEKRKILFIITDGYPSIIEGDNKILLQDLKMKVAELTKIGIQVIAFGIETSYGKDIYPNYVQVDSIDNLLKVGVVEIKKSLVKSV